MQAWILFLVPIERGTPRRIDPFLPWLSDMSRLGRLPAGSLCALGVARVGVVGPTRAKTRWHAVERGWTAADMVQIQSPRLFFGRTPSADARKSLRITGKGVAAPTSCSNSAAPGSDAPAELRQLLSRLHVGKFKSRRQSSRTFSGPVNSRLATASLD
jgi:hypothetical protein